MQLKNGLSCFSEIQNYLIYLYNYFKWHSSPEHKITAHRSTSHVKLQNDTQWIAEWSLNTYVHIPIFSTHKCDYIWNRVIVDVVEGPNTKPSWI